MKKKTQIEGNHKCICCVGVGVWYRHGQEHAFFRGVGVISYGHVLRSSNS